LPSLQAKENEVLLRELLKRWSNYKIITLCLSRLFRSLETYDMRKSMDHSLEEIGFLSFYDLVGHENIPLKTYTAFSNFPLIMVIMFCVL